MLKPLQSLTQSALQGCTVLGQSCSSNIIFGTVKFSSGERLCLLRCSLSRTIINNGNYVTGELLCSVGNSKQLRQPASLFTCLWSRSTPLTSNMQTLSGYYNLQFKHGTHGRLHSAHEIDSCVTTVIKNQDFMLTCHFFL